MCRIATREGCAVILHIRVGEYISTSISAWTDAQYHRFTRNIEKAGGEINAGDVILNRGAFHQHINISGIDINHVVSIVKKMCVFPKYVGISVQFDIMLGGARMQRYVRLFPSYTTEEIATVLSEHSGSLSIKSSNVIMRRDDVNIYCVNLELLGGQSPQTIDELIIGIFCGDILKYSTTALEHLDIEPTEIKIEGISHTHYGSEILH